MAGSAAGPYYRAPICLGGLQGHTKGHHGAWEGCRAILQGTMVAGRAGRLYYRAPSWLGGLKGHTIRHCGGW